MSRIDAIKPREPGRPLPELRETPVGRRLRRLLLPLIVGVLALLAWAGFTAVDVLDLDLGADPGIPSAGAPAGEP